MKVEHAETKQIRQNQVHARGSSRLKPERAADPTHSAATPDAAHADKRTTHELREPESKQRTSPYTRNAMPVHPSAKLHPLVQSAPKRRHRRQHQSSRRRWKSRNTSRSATTDHRAERHPRTRRAAQIGNSCDVAALYVGLRSKLGDGVRMDPNSSVGDRVQRRQRRPPREQSERGPQRDGRTADHAGTAHLHPRRGERSATGVTTGKDVRIAESVQVGDGCSFAKPKTKVAPNARDRRADERGPERPDRNGRRPRRHTAGPDRKRLHPGRRNSRRAG